MEPVFAVTNERYQDVEFVTMCRSNKYPQSSSTRSIADSKSLSSQITSAVTVVIVRCLLNCPYVDSVVFAMSSDKLNENSMALKIQEGNKSIFVASEIKDDSLTYSIS